MNPIGIILMGLVLAANPQLQESRKNDRGARKVSKCVGVSLPCILICAAIFVLLLFPSVKAQPGPPLTKAGRERLLKLVDRNILRDKHHLDLTKLTSLPPQIFLSIDSITPPSPKDSDGLVVNYTLTNFTLERATGVVIGRFQAHELTNIDGSKPTNVNVSPGQSLIASLTLTNIHEGQDTLELAYRDRVTCRQVPGPIPAHPTTVCTAGLIVTASTDVVIAKDLSKIDEDHDRIPDIIENQLLAHFRPYYRFSKNGGDDESNRPADVVWFVRRSDLYDHQTETADDQILTKAQLDDNPALILTASSIGSSNVAKVSKKTEYYLNLANEFRGGEPDWTKIQDEAIGLYGHVAPLCEKGSNPAAPTCLPGYNPLDLTAYKIEYWQFYAFDPVPGQIDCYPHSDSHEGDWVGVELVVESDQTTVRRVRHNIHSTNVVFDLSQGTFVDIGNGVREYRGTGPLRPYRGYIDLDVKGPAGVGWAQNNLLRFFCNEDGCTHPIAYIEHGGHEAWPTEYWNWPVVASHGGDSPHAYLVSTPQNVGEIGNPMPGCLACALVVGFNGHWGACGGDPPDGPPLKGTWGRP